MSFLFLFCFCLLASFAAHAQRSLTGRVTSSEDQSPLPGVNIIVKGTTNGTITDADGRFNLPVVSDNDVIVFSFVGFISQEMSVGGRSNFDIVLQADTQQLSEVVVTALGIEKDAATLDTHSRKARNCAGRSWRALLRHRAERRDVAGHVRRRSARRVRELQPDTRVLLVSGYGDKCRNRRADSRRARARETDRPVDSCREELADLADQGLNRRQRCASRGRIAGCSARKAVRLGRARRGRTASGMSSSPCCSSERDVVLTSRSIFASAELSCARNSASDAHAAAHQAVERRLEQHEVPDLADLGHLRVG